MPKKPLHDLLSRLASAEADLQQTTFVSPCVRNGTIQTRIGGLIQTFQPQPPTFEGWGLFQPVSETRARLVEEAPLPLIEQYLQVFDPFRLFLIRSLKRATWLAYPMNESDARQRFGAPRPVLVHLVTEGRQFEPIVARGNGKVWWFEDVDRKADPMLCTKLREAFKAATETKDLSFPGLTPEMRTAYQIAAQHHQAFNQKNRHRRDENRLRQALAVGGGALQSFQEREDFWEVEWTTANGEENTSIISKSDLTVISSGICLSGRDQDFDLQSLVRVIERMDEY